MITGEVCRSGDGGGNPFTLKTWSGFEAVKPDSKPEFLFKKKKCI